MHDACMLATLARVRNDTGCLLNTNAPGLAGTGRHLWEMQTGSGSAEVLHVRLDLLWGAMRLDLRRVLSCHVGLTPTEIDSSMP